MTGEVKIEGEKHKKRETICKRIGVEIYRYLVHELPAVGSFAEAGHLAFIAFVRVK